MAYFDGIFCPMKVLLLSIEKLEFRPCLKIMSMILHLWSKLPRSEAIFQIYIYMSTPIHNHMPLIHMVRG